MWRYFVALHMASLQLIFLPADAIVGSFTSGFGFFGRDVRKTVREWAGNIFRSPAVEFLFCFLFLSIVTTFYTGCL